MIALLAASVILAAHTTMLLIQRWYTGWEPVSPNATPMRAQSLNR